MWRSGGTALQREAASAHGHASFDTALNSAGKKRQPSEEQQLRSDSAGQVDANVINGASAVGQEPLVILIGTCQRQCAGEREQCGLATVDPAKTRDVAAEGHAPAPKKCQA